MFGNISDIKNFHTTFLTQLEENPQLTAGHVAKVFLEAGPSGFMIYEHYYLNHPKAVNYLQLKQEDEVFNSLLLGCQTVLGHQLPLQTYLLKPVQRLLKYPLLLQEMLKAAVGVVLGHPCVPANEIVHSPGPAWPNLEPHSAFLLRSIFGFLTTNYVGGENTLCVVQDGNAKVRARQQKKVNLRPFFVLWPIYFVRIVWANVEYARVCRQCTVLNVRSGALSDACCKVFVRAR